MAPSATPTSALLLTWETSVPEHEARALYRVYHKAFAPLSTLSAVRQLLREDEFLEEMSDPRIEKLVARLDGEPVGLTIMTSALHAIPWISPEFYAGRYPDHYARGALYYVAFTLADADHRGAGSYVAMLDVLLQRLTDERAVCVYDICTHNNVQMHFADHLRSRANRWAVAEEQVLDTQVFYAGVFHEPRDRRTHHAAVAPPATRGPGHPD
jgi:hypothetical protein